jgi:hypothetical protein
VRATPGTGVAVTKFLPFRSENIKQNINYLDTQTLSSRLTLRKTKAGTKTVEGSFTTELPNTTLATLLKHCMGAVATTGAGPYTHTLTPGDTRTLGLTVQVGRPDASGTWCSRSPMRDARCPPGRSLRPKARSPRSVVNLIGMSETTGTALATASYDSSWSPFVFQEASLTVAAGAENNVREFNLTGNNQIQTRFRLGSATSKNPLGIGVREYTGTVTVDFDGLTDYGRFVNGTESALVATFNNGTQTLTITQNVQFVGETPEVSGNDLLAHNMPYRALSSSSDAASITAVLVNSETTAA